MKSGGMWSRLQGVEQRYDELSRQLSSPELHSDARQLMKVTKEHKDLSEVVATYRAYLKAESELKGAKEIVESAKDDEMLELAKEELGMLEGELRGLEERLRILLLPKDPNDSKNVILEIRAGAGGDEAAIFAGELFRMFTRYSEDKGYRVEVLNASEASSGGYKEIIAMITGAGAFSRLKYERGVHRVQRVPETENQGRVHTSTCTVAIMPEAEDVEIAINDKDLRIDVFRSSGPGGQSVNTTDSAVRVTHLPTGLVVSMQDEKSQHKNKEKALKVLKARLLELEQAKADEARRSEIKGQVGKGDRSEKVRTYNFPQSRITDHRIGLTLHSLDAVMNGDLDQVVDPLIAYYQAEALKGSAN